MLYADKHISEADIQAMLATYRHKVRHPQLATWTITGTLDVTSAVQSGIQKAGVYLCYDANRALIYIGMSLGSVAQRISAHLSDRERASDFWRLREIAFVQLVLMKAPWEAPALEAYLQSCAEAYPSDLLLP